MSTVSRMLGVSQIRVREALVQHQRNKLRDEGRTPPPLKEMLKGDVAARFGVPKAEAGGRPATHEQPELDVRPASPRAKPSVVAVPKAGVTRLLVTAIDPDAPVHEGFHRNLRSYARSMGARFVLTVAGRALRSHRARFGGLLVDEPLSVGDRVDLALAAPPAARLARPLDAVRHRTEAEWTVVPSAVVQLETPPRLFSETPRMLLTTGAMTMPRRPAAVADVGAVIVEVTGDGRSYCRHVTAPADGDGAFQDLDREVRDGRVRQGRRVEALVFGDIHHAWLDAGVASATWGMGRSGDLRPSLVDRLRPGTMVFHDVCDFEARNPHDRLDHLKRFAQATSGKGDVRAELAAAARFLEETARPWARSVVVGSNHDAMFTSWLRGSDYRDDPQNAEFYLSSALAVHRRMKAGGDVDGFFEETLRSLGGSGLDGVRFLRAGESLSIAGVECGIHGHVGVDGRPGDLRVFERLGRRLVMGHTHRPSTREGVCCAGTSASGLEYARGPLTASAPGHVVIYSTGARQHLILLGDAFHA